MLEVGNIGASKKGKFFRTTALSRNLVEKLMAGSGEAGY